MEMGGTLKTGRHSEKTSHHKIYIAVESHDHPRLEEGNAHRRRRSLYSLRSEDNILFFSDWDTKNYIHDNVKAY